MTDPDALLSHPPLVKSIDLWDNPYGLYHAIVASPPGITRRRIHQALLAPTRDRRAPSTVFTCGQAESSVLPRARVVSPCELGSPSVDPIRGMFPLWTSDEFALIELAQHLTDVFLPDVEPASETHSLVVRLVEQHLLQLAWRHGLPDLFDLRAQLLASSAGPTHEPLTRADGAASLWTAQAAVIARALAEAIGRLLEMKLPCFAREATPMPHDGDRVFDLAALRMQPDLSARAIFSSALFLKVSALQARRLPSHGSALLFDDVPDLLNLLPSHALINHLRTTRRLGVSFIFSYSSLLQIAAGRSTAAALLNTEWSILFDQRRAEIDWYRRQGRLPDGGELLALGDHVGVYRASGGVPALLNLTSQHSAPSVRLPASSLVH